MAFFSYRLVKENNEAWFKRVYQKPTTIDIGEAITHIRDVQRLIQPFIEAKEKGEKVLVVKYEDGVEEMYRKALEFLGIAYKRPTTAFIKQTVKPIEEMITNYDEVAQSEIGHYLHTNHV